jgi:hypothetical protein
LTAAIWRRYGYVAVRGENDYVAESDYYQKHLEARRTELYRQLRDGVETKIMQREGWRRDDATGRWESTRATASETAAPRQDVLDQLRDFALGRAPAGGQPLLSEPDDASFDFWGPSEPTESDRGAATRDQAESIFDE